MSSKWWTRLFTRSAARPTNGAGPVVVIDAPQDVAVGLTAPAEPKPALEWRELEHSAASAPILASSASLGRSMAGRVRMLLDGAGADALGSDGPALVELLLEGGGSCIPQPPDAALEALEVARRPRSSIREIVTLLERDPMLGQAVLKLANSGGFRLGDGTVATLGGAVQRLGKSLVESVLMGSVVESLLCRPGGPFDTLVDQTWSHMQRTAPIARDLAPAFGVRPDAAFSFALFHDVGKLVIFDQVSTLRREARRELSIPEPFFRRLLQHLHEPLGGLAMLRWGMGGEAAHAVGEHHRRPVPETADPVTELVFVAEAVELAHRQHAPLEWEQWWTRGGITADRREVAARARAAEEA